MIGFFRRIRKKLANENKFILYSRYAIGEIVLVVIGILIALQINNWNENKKKDAARRDYYAQLILDLEDDKEYYKLIISDLESFAEGYAEYREVFTHQNLDVSSLILAVSSFEFNGRVIDFSSTTISTLISSGDFKNFPHKLANKLTVYLKSQEGIKIVANQNYKYANNILTRASEFLNPDLQKRLQNQPDIFEYLNIENNLPKIIVLVDSYMFWKENGEIETIKSFDFLIKDADAIITLINEELKK